MKQAMNSTADLSPSQRSFAESNDSSYVIACPGAGKTRAIISRFVRRVNELERQGIALLSFTNAAVGEAIRRSNVLGINVAHPHFVGTFDSFIQRNVVGPMIASRKGASPRFLESWDVLHGGRVIPNRREPHIYFSLEHFEFDRKNNATLVADRIGGIYRNSLLNAYNKAPENCNRLAVNCRNRLIENNFYSCSEARRILLGFLEGKSRQKLLDILSARFAEIIVDEAQDCGTEELALLEALHDAGVVISMVGDPDQAIYEFRNALPERVAELGSKLHSEVVFDENFRSSHSICKTNSYLRMAGKPDRAVGENADCGIPLYIFGSKEVNSILPAFTSLLDKHQISHADAIFLSHKGKDARQACQRQDSEKETSSLVQLAALAALLLEDTSATPTQKKKAMDKFERKFLDISPGGKSKIAEEFANELNVSYEELTSKFIRILLGAKVNSSNRNVFAENLRKGFETNNLIVPPANLRACAEDQWNSLLIGEVQSNVAYGTIHSVKGQEFQAVCLVLPRINPNSDGGLSLLLQGLEGEARRVVYVGASRARRLLCLAIHADDRDRVAEMVTTWNEPLIEFL